MILMLIWAGALYASHRLPGRGRNLTAAETAAPASAPAETMEPRTTATTGPEKVKGEMPKLIGLSAAKAQKKLKNAGFHKVRLKYQVVYTGKSGVVLKQSIPVDQQVKYQRRIILTISRKAKLAATVTPAPEQAGSRAGQNTNTNESQSGGSSDKKTNTKKNVVGSLDALLDE